MAGGGNAEGEFGFQIAPMLDVLFVLLLFFMVSAGSQKHEVNLTTQLPGSGSGASVPMEIGIDEDGQVSVSGAPIDDAADHNLPQLVARLKGVVAANATQPIVITPTRSTRHQRVVDVLNACAGANVKNLSFGQPGD